MQTERVTFLTTPDHKAALDAFAASSGRSVGHVVREATSRYIAEPRTNGSDEEAEEERALARVVDELDKLLPEMHRKLDSMENSIAKARRAIRESLIAVEATK